MCSMKMKGMTVSLKKQVQTSEATRVKMDTQVLIAENISKFYGGKPILNDLSLELNKGEAIALVGINGSGKSTLIRILAGLTRPSGGSVKIGESITCGLIPDHYEKINMSIRKYMQYMQGIEETHISADTVDFYYKEFRLESFIDTPMKYLSKGTLQKAAAIQALLSKKDILFIDEPLSGQDTLSQMNFVREMKKRKEDGMAIVMSSHDTYLIEELSDRILQIEDGKIADGTDYVYGDRITKCVFLIRNHKSLTNLSDIIRQKTSDEQLSIGDYGSLCKVEADIRSSKTLLQLFLEEDINIIKYEEMEESC